MIVLLIINTLLLVGVVVYFKRKSDENIKLINAKFDAIKIPIFNCKFVEKECEKTVIDYDLIVEKALLTEFNYKKNED